MLEIEQEVESQSAMRAIRYRDYVMLNQLPFVIMSQSAMRAIRYRAGKVDWAFLVALLSQSAMRAIRYRAVIALSLAMLMFSRNPLCVQ